MSSITSLWRRLARVSGVEEIRSRQYQPLQRRLASTAATGPTISVQDIAQSKSFKAKELHLLTEAQADRAITAEIDKTRATIRALETLQDHIKILPFDVLANQDVETYHLHKKHESTVALFQEAIKQYRISLDHLGDLKHTPLPELDLAPFMAYQVAMSKRTTLELRQEIHLLKQQINSTKSILNEDEKKIKKRHVEMFGEARHKTLMESTEKYQTSLSNFENEEATADDDFANETEGPTRSSADSKSARSSRQVRPKLTKPESAPKSMQEQMAALGIT